MRARSAAAMVTMLMVLALAACTEEEAEPTATSQASTATASATATPTEVPATPTPTPSPTPMPVHDLDAKTGDPQVDAVLRLIEAGNVEGLAADTAILERPCEKPRPVSPQPFVCQDGEEVGTPIRGVWIVDGEGGFWPPDRYDAAAAMFLGTIGSLHSAYRVEEAETDTVIVFRASEEDDYFWREIRLLAGEITG